MNNSLLIAHISTLAIAYSLFLFAFAASLALIVQENAIKQKRINSWSQKLPKLKLLDKLNLRFLSIGVLLMLCGLGSGYIYGRQKGISFFLGDPQLLSAASTLFIYACLLFAINNKGYRGTRAAWLSVIGFLMALASYWGVQLTGGSFHVF